MLMFVNANNKFTELNDYIREGDLAVIVHHVMGGHWSYLMCWVVIDRTLCAGW